ncbi:MAG: hypothetical protein JSS82_10780 [Bacteroidetes bacterium]|nr:hypothetical protein [Bacteroidota bacterium]
MFTLLNGMEGNLGISIGTWSIGVAVIADNELLEWRVKTFPGIWSACKLKRILKTIEQIMDDRYRITSVGIKTPISALCSTQSLELAEAIWHMAAERKMRVTMCSLLQLKRRYGEPTKRTNKGIFVSALVIKYPELSMYAKRVEKRKGYFAKLFEAIVCAEIAAEAQH